MFKAREEERKAAKPDHSLHKCQVSRIVFCITNTKPLGRATTAKDSWQEFAYNELSANFHIYSLQITVDKIKRTPIFLPTES